MASNCSWKAVLCFVTAVVIHGVTARKFTVGGKAGWLPPASGSATYNDWAERNRFLIGDILVFKYNPSEDSVAQVNAEDYNSCSTSNSIASFKDGNTEFQIPSHGPFYFISGNSSNCHKGEKLIVVVLAPRNPGPSPSPAASTVVPSPAPTTALSPSHAPTVASPAPAPASAVPSPAPTTALSPSPAPTVASPAPASAVPSPAPTTALSPSPAPTVASPAPASVSVPSVSPVAAPVNTAPLFASPSPAPITSEGEGVPSAAASASCFVNAVVTIGTLAFSLVV